MVRVRRVAVIQAALLLFALGLLGRTAHVQLAQGAEWSKRAERQHVATSTIPASRGRILDRAGVPLAESREVLRISIAPREVRSLETLGRALREAGVPSLWIARAVDRSRAWVDLPGRYLPADVAELARLRGVYARPDIDRVYAPSSGARRLVGRTGSDGTGLDGLELAFDSLLTGVSGRSPRFRDPGGRGIESPAARATAASPGHSVSLTINLRLQEITDRALDEAVATMGATGGDIVVVDPHGGAVLAMASRRPGPQSGANTALTEPFEPGSTLKPFTAATLLSLRRAHRDEVIETYDGVYRMPDRTITDLKKAPSMTLTEVIRWSSNVGMVRFAERLEPHEQYSALRDFGFGTPTGAPYPSEAAGTLRHPRRWSRLTSSALAMGYEIAVTPLQLAMAYASIANGGELLEPALIAEIRAPDGSVRYRQQRRVVRRVMSPEVAESVREMLVGVVEQGTAGGADLASYAVAGKTGTARASRVGARGYSEQKYFATFVGMFPAAEPQYVILVKLDSPRDIFGGATAAPVSRVVLQAALAARDAALDRQALSARRRVVATVSRAGTVPASPAGAATAEASSAPSPVSSSPARSKDGKSGATAPANGALPFVVALDAPARRQAPPQRAERLMVPDVRGFPLRDAVRTLHESGFQVELGRGSPGVTSPAAGTLAAAGSTVRLLHAR